MYSLFPARIGLMWCVVWADHVTWDQDKTILIHIACIGVAAPWLVTLQASGMTRWGEQPNSYPCWLIYHFFNVMIYFCVLKIIILPILWWSWQAILWCTKITNTLKPCCQSAIGLLLLKWTMMIRSCLRNFSYGVPQPENIFWFFWDKIQIL